MRRLAIPIAAGVIILLLAGAQLVLPGIAAQRLRDQLGKSGKVLQVEVDAFPAIELLWHRADRVLVRVAQYRSSTGSLHRLLDRTAVVGSLDASASELDTGLLTLHDATLRKRGNELTGTARVTEQDLRSSLPILQSVQPVASGEGRLTLRGTATLLGVSATIDATVRTQDGQLVLAPDLPFGGLATVTVFGDPKLEVQGIRAIPTPGGFIASATARLR